MREPQEIQDEEYEQVAERVAAVDVAKASGMVCTRVPDPSRPGKRVTKVWRWMPRQARSPSLPIT
jgi:transposase